MKTGDMIQSKWLKKEDFEKPTVLSIKGCSLEDLGRGEERWCLWFNEKTKGLLLNVSKIRALEAAFGQDTDMWLGKKVRLSHDPSVEFGGRTVGGIKLETPPAKASALVAPAPAPAPAPKEFDDDLSDIPW